MDYIGHYAIESSFESPEIPSDLTDLIDWDKKWEKILSTMSVNNAYALMKDMLLKDRSHTTPISEMRNNLQRFQKGIVEFRFWDPTCDDTTGDAWVLLNRGERKRHVLYGLRQSCKSNQRLRVLCPEITSSAMLKNKGVAFLIFITMYSRGVKDAGPENLYFLPNASWQSVVDDLETCSEEDKFAFTHLTLQRNLTIVQFVMHSCLSIQDDCLTPNSSMHLATSKCLKGVPNEGSVVCENCGITPEKMGKNTKFLVCGVCKQKLGALLYYCSKACQRKAWPDHKQNCGKKTMRKFPDSPSEATSIASLHEKFTDKFLESVGFGTEHPDNPHSPALRHQVMLLRRDPHVDYYLFDGTFDEAENAIGIQFGTKSIRSAFRSIRSGAIFSAHPQGIGVLAAHLIKTIELNPVPGVNRDTIMAQICAEYGDVTEKVKKAEWMHEPGETALEGMARNMDILMSGVVGQSSKSRRGL